MAPKWMSGLIWLGMLVASGNALSQPASDSAAIYRGVSTAVRFDVSPPLSQLALRPPTRPATGKPRKDPPTGFEGRFGPQDVDALVQQWKTRPGESGEIPAPSVGFDAFTDASSPPDPVGAVGPNHYVAMANSVYAVYSKTGTLLAGPANINTIWTGFGGACELENAGDPIVLYDRHADRWLLTQFTAAGPTYFNCVAISQTGNPGGAYFRYAFSTGTNFPDYPKYGSWPDAYYISTREFSGSPYVGVGAYAINRAQMVVGNPAPQVVSFFVPLGATPYDIGDGLLPSNLDSAILPPAGSPNFFVGTRDDGGPYGAPSDAVNIFRFHVDFAVPANSTFSGPTVVPVAAFDSMFPCSPGSRDCLAQPTTTQKIDHLGYRQRPMHRAAYRNFGTHESIVTNQSVEGASVVSGIRWWEIRSPNGTPTIFQESTYAPGDGVHRWMGSIAQDRHGNMALGYSVTNATTVFPGIRYTGRLVGDPLGTLPQGEGTFINGVGSQTTSARWGDYTAMTVDPTDDCTFWYVNQYLAANGGTKTLRVGAFKYPSCIAAPRSDLVVDFGGPGLWQRLNNFIWAKIHASSPQEIATGDLDGGGKDEVIVSFAGSGVWVRYNNATWTKLHVSDAVHIAAGDLDGGGKDEAILDLGASGIWGRFNNATWLKLHNATSQGLAVGDFNGNNKGDLIVDFGGGGLWVRYDNAAWLKLHASSPGALATGDLDGGGKDELIVDLGASGIWARYNNATWVKLHSTGAQGLATGDLDNNGKDELLVDFGAGGLWGRYNNTTWSKLHNSSPTNLLATDLDGNGTADPVADFGAAGIWARYDNVTWARLHASTADDLAAGAFD